MRRKTDKGKAKPAAKEESPEKVAKKQRHSRRRRKSSSSSDSDSKGSKKDVAESSISKPLEIQVQDIELPQGDNPVVLPTNDNNKSNAEDSQPEWKEDKTFWETDATKGQEPNATNADNDENSLWKVQSANGAGGEIQKLKICRQKPTESPELGETSLRIRLNRGGKGDGRSTDDSAHEESEKDTKKSKHRNRTSSRNSPLVSPSVVCDMSGDSPTKIKIINVGHLNSDSKGGSVTKTISKDTPSDKIKKCDDVEESSMTSDTLDIALPSEPLEQAGTEEGAPQKSDEPLSLADIPEPNANTESPLEHIPAVHAEEPFKGFKVNVDEKRSDTIVEESVTSPKISAPPSLSLKKDEESHSTNKSSEDSDSSEYKTKRNDLQSTVQRKPASPKKSYDSEEEDKKKDMQRQDSSDTQDVKENVNNKENEAVNSISSKESNVEDNKTKGEPRPMPRKRRWGSSKSSRPNKRPSLNISTASLKELLPDAKPVPADELQLSVEEEEEGQLDDDDEEDEVVAFVAKEEEKQMEKERLREEKQKEKEKEIQDKKKRKERFEKNKPEQPVLKTPSDKGTASRKILLLSDDAKKLARSPSPPRFKPTSVLYITQLVRPFTIQQLKNLLLRTGTIIENGFWIDRIKSKCYVEYATEDQAVETRHALHGVRWPTSNPKTLVVEFSSHDDMLIGQALEKEPVVPRKAVPLNMVEGWVQDQARIKERNRRAVVREWDVGKPEHPDEALEFELKIKEKRELEKKARKERHQRRSATPEAEPPARKTRRKEDAPAKLLDDLFRKTKTSPCIYWLPLTQEQIAVKEEIRRQHMAEHERRMAELKKAEIARRERERRNRK